MQLKNTVYRFGWVSITFHWVMAVSVIGLLGVGLYMADLPKSDYKYALYGWHKEWGVVVLMLATLRLAWWLGNVVPVLPETMPVWQRRAAHFVHTLFYFFIFAQPLTGWMMSSAGGYPVSFFGLFVMPDLVGPNKALGSVLAGMHYWFAMGLIVTIIGHVAASLYHHYILKDEILRRMLKP